MSQQKLKATKSKTKRRGNNEGTIYQRKDGRWTGMVTTGYKTDGTPIRKTVYGTSRQDVAKQVAALTEKVFTNGYTTESASKERNFEKLCKEWFDLFVSGTTSSTTEEVRRNILKHHICPAFGMYDIRDVDLIKLQRFFREKVRAGLSSDYIHKMKNLLNNFFKYAVSQRLVQINPVTDVVLCKFDTDDKKEETKALRPEIRANVLNWLKENPTLNPIITTFMFTGLRPQELIALKWDTVDLERKTISIKKALKKIVNFDDEGNVISRSETIGKTKTKKGVRSFTIPNEVVNVLTEWKLYCKENSIKSEFVFPNTKTGEIRTYSGLRSSLKRFVKKHNLQDENITLYTFRHTFATILLEQRENPKIVAELMGHEDASTTLDFYSHVVSDQVYEQTARTLDTVWSSLIENKN